MKPALEEKRETEHDHSGHLLSCSVKLGAETSPTVKEV